ncbi:hypothetical protein AG0111_0g8620 [Alternaria gaisen]|uniref:Uncharacterized protein n=1 Tax=Alternaria gaisen TaxID=167740 RepID=A0ACB6FGC0_9PLEO|nr:hypothetical protein AG0111_0g8620 [Alternaria gaisen]
MTPAVILPRYMISAQASQAFGVPVAPHPWPPNTRATEV